MSIPYGMCGPGRPEDPRETAKIEAEKRETRERSMGIVPPKVPAKTADIPEPLRAEVERMLDGGYWKVPILYHGIEVTTNSDATRQFLPERPYQCCSYCRRQYAAAEATCVGCGAPRLGSK